MSLFWRYAKEMLHYKGMLALAAVGLAVDSICAFAGFGAVILIIKQLFSKDASAHDLIADRLADDSLTRWIGDHSYLADAIPQDQFWGIAMLLGVVFVITLVGAGGRFTHQYFTITVSIRTVMRIRKRMFTQLIHAYMSKTSVDSTGDNLMRVVANTNELGGGFTMLTNRTIRSILQGLIALSWALIISPSLTGLFLVGTPVIVVVVRKFGKTIRRATKRAMVGYGAMSAAVTEALTALRVVKVNQAEGYERRRFNRLNRTVYAQEMKARIARSLSSPVIEVISLIGIIAIMVAVSYYLFRVNPDAGVERLGVVITMLALAATNLKPLANLHNDLQRAVAAATRIDEVFDIDVERTAHHGGAERKAKLPRVRRGVEFRGVTFTYPGADAPALRDINLTVGFGEACAIVGTNGSGKSTLTYLLPRLYEPDAGAVLFDGQNIANFSLRSVRNQVAAVTQEAILFDADVRNNIAYGSHSPSEAQVVDAAQRAFAHEFISELPEGYDTQVGEWGGKLSGGQRQRITIARAILRNPAVLVLDEATSQIDADSEAKITEALARFEKDRTTFVIAHRLSTVIDADTIVVMDAGRIVAQGTHSQLLESCDLYRVLCRTQLQPSDG